VSLKHFIDGHEHNNNTLIWAIRGAKI